MLFFNKTKANFATFFVGFFLCFLIMSFPLFVMADSQACDPAIQICNPLKVKTIQCLFREVLKIAAEIGSVFIVIGIIYSGFLFVKAQGNQEELAVAKKAITYTAIGAMLVLGAWAFSTGIANTISTITGDQTVSDALKGDPCKP